MFAASAKSFWDVYKTNPEVLNSDNMMTLGAGAIVSFIVALIAIKFFIEYVQKNGFKLFGWYRIVLGIVMLVLIWKGVVKG